MDMPSYRTAVSKALAAWPASLSQFVDDPSGEAAFTEASGLLSSALEGGKRIRACLAYAGMACAGTVSEECAVGLGLALELFQASALVHDDVIDNSPLRRGKPALHSGASAIHEANAWLGDSANYGHAAAITLGDVLLAGAMEECARALGSCPHSAEAYSLFTSMMKEVGYGQFLDIREEHVPLASTHDAVERAKAIVLHKSARYSVELPLALGACVAGADSPLMAALRAVGLAAGMAFQMRDDVLGVFGEEATTGKPACGDIAEGKRTILLALARERLGPADREYLDSCLGRPLSDSDVARIRQLITASGAYEAHEKLIRSYEDEAAAALDSVPRQCPHVRREGLEALGALLDELEGRKA